MSSKVNLLKKKIAKLQAQLEVEMAKNSKVSDGTLSIPIGKKKNHSETNSSYSYQRT